MLQSKLGSKLSKLSILKTCMCTGCPKKGSAFDQKYTKSLSLNFQSFFHFEWSIHLNLEFKIKIVEIRWKLSETHILIVEHSKFTSQILAIFEYSMLKIFAKHGNDLHNICSMLSKQISTNFKVNWSLMTLIIGQGMSTNNPASSWSVDCAIKSVWHIPTLSHTLAESCWTVSGSCGWGTSSILFLTHPQKRKS